MCTPSGKIDISLPFLGYQNISNALAASALAFSLNIPLKKIQDGLLSTPLLPGRLESIKLSTNKTLINDTYNSNVASMTTAIKVLENMPGYKILVVGDMAELGENSPLYHRIIGNIASLSKIDNILSIGKNSYEISKICKNSIHFLKKEKLKKILKKMILKKDQVTILIKGSRNAKMETIVEYLIREFKKNADLA
ncbi:cyanophycin synthetase [uncultured Buchnera sp.]|jgi:UDP-N-acetylmuramyl pentapeptide synthase|uniref:glutamate ligase domain-containing protein n=1 Tax=uncultured Buchnera sp. TaxID=574037 RepID=UPI0025D3D3EE|nr:cyanophycin synthetase [uncultured Buchnera sp.]